MSKKKATEPKKPGDKQMIYLNDNQAVLDFINQQSNVSDGVRLAILFFLEHIGNIDSQMYFPPYVLNGGNVTSFVRSLIDNGSIKVPETSILKNPNVVIDTSFVSNEAKLLEEIKEIKTTLSQLQDDYVPRINELAKKEEIKISEDKKLGDIRKDEKREEVNEVPSITKDETKVEIYVEETQQPNKQNEDPEEPEIPSFLMDRL
ncbi:hypothetical protein LIS82_27830 (plasmid) [Cytobacillus solani]|uniref:hypothetical protein n=1 Tax=Cytobacillus solani TaxID=1637975 RepID=UPI00207ABDE7|nr:hypothetical protein [Cytobacillus solani]USK57785.1 hypothetical protein LIS82_27830 [Cytobacillus solani]